MVVDAARVVELRVREAYDAAEPAWLAQVEGGALDGGRRPGHGDAGGVDLDVRRAGDREPLAVDRAGALEQAALPGRLGETGDGHREPPWARSWDLRSGNEERPGRGPGL